MQKNNLIKIYKIIMLNFLRQIINLKYQTYSMELKKLLQPVKIVENRHIIIKYFQI